MLPVLLLTILAGAPFWETKAPADWSAEELRILLHESPWARMHRVYVRGAEVPPVHLYLATACPMAAAEEEFRKRNPPSGRALEYAQDEEYREFMKDNPGRYIVLAVLLARPELSAKPDAMRRMEKQSVLRIGERKYELVGHFPPAKTGGDPYLRLVFPRDVRPGDKVLAFDLYLPGAPLPYRDVRFEIESLNYKDVPEY